MALQFRARKRSPWPQVVYGSIGGCRAALPTARRAYSPVPATGSGALSRLSLLLCLLPAANRPRSLATGCGNAHRADRRQGGQCATCRRVQRRLLSTGPAHRSTSSTLARSPLSFACFIRSSFASSRGKGVDARGSPVAFSAAGLRVRPERVHAGSTLSCAGIPAAAAARSSRAFLLSRLVLSRGVEYVKTAERGLVDSTPKRRGW
jgi:hypothetical protein